MIIVSDTSPINYLILIGQIDLLPQLFEQIIIPQAVYNELSDSLAPPGETHLNFIDKTPFLCINERIGIYRLIDFFRVIVMV
jgi:predicted nucleic acid-binding protein